MLCPRCGAELFPGMEQCPECGYSAGANTCRTASITVSAREARQGVFKSLNMPGLTMPLRFRVKPGTKNGARILVNNAVFAEPDGSTMLIPVRVTVHVKTSPAVVLVPILVALLCASFFLGARRIISALADDGMSQNQLQIDPTYPEIPAEMQTDPTDIPQLPTVEPLVTEPETQPKEQTVITEKEQTSESPIPYYEIRPLLHQLDDRLLTNLEAIYEAAMAFEPSVEFPCEMTPEELGYLTSLMHTEFPELMQLDNTLTSTYYSDSVTGYVTSYELPYVLNEAEYDRRYDACEAAVRQIAESAQGGSVWDQELYVFEYIAETCTYDSEVEAANTPYGVLVNRRAKCDGISLAMKWIMEELGIPCLVITGDPTVGDIGHAWNMIELEGAYYNVDVTMDTRKDGDECPTLYCAMNVTNEMVLQNYVLTPVFAELLTLPQVTTMEKSYHVQNGSYVAAGDEWQRFLKDSFLRAYESGEGELLQFETQEAFEACLNGINDYINEIVQSEQLPSCSWQTWRSDEFRVLSLNVSR